MSKKPENKKEEIEDEETIPPKEDSDAKQLEEESANEEVVDEEGNPQSEVDEKSGQDESNDDNEEGEDVGESGENWETDLKKKMVSTDMKKHLRKTKRMEKREKFNQKKRELNAKTTEMVEGQFMKIFDKRVLPYTILFIIGAALLGIIVAIPFGDSVDFLGKNMTNFDQFLVIALAFSMIIGYALIYWISQNAKMHEILFGEGGFVSKIFLNLLVLAIGLGFCFFWWMVLDPGFEEGGLGFLTFQQLFGIILALVYFGWNAGQIFFVKVSIENQAIGAEAKFRIKNENVETSKQMRKINVRNYLIVFIPVVVHIVFVTLFILMDTPEFYNNILDTTPTFIQKFTPDLFYFGEWMTGQTETLPDVSNFIIFLTDYIPAVWIEHRPLLVVLSWSIIVLILIIALTSKQISLYKKSKENETPNVFSSTFFLIFFIFLYLRLFSIVNTGIGLATPADEKPDQLIGQIIDGLTSILLMLITIFNLLRGFGQRMKNKVGKSKITEYNLAFLMFILVATYWGGQWSLMSGEGLSKAALSIATGFIVVIVYVAFYYWYSGWILERRGFARKQNYTLVETKEMMTELSMNIKDRLLQTIENEETIMNTLNEYMLEKKVILPGGKDEDGLVQSLDEKEDDKTATEKLIRMQTAHEEAQIEKNQYEDALKNLKDAKKAVPVIAKEITALEKEVAALPKDIAARSEKTDGTLQNLEEKIKQQQETYNAVLKEFKGRKEPKEPKIPYNEEGEVDEVQQKQLMAGYKKILKEIENLHRKVETEGKKLAKLEQDQEKAQSVKVAIQQEEKDAQLLRKSLEDTLQKQIDNENLIRALETDLVLLKSRAEDTAPLLDAANTSLKSAEEEDKAYNELVTGQDVEKDAENKLIEAQKFLGMNQENFDQAQNVVDRTRTISEIDGDLELLTEEVTKSKEKVSASEKKRVSKEKIVEIKSAAVENSKVLFNESKDLMEEAEHVIKSAEKELNKAQINLSKGEEAKAEYENAKDDYQLALGDANQSEKMDDIESEMANIQDQIKVSKSDLKLEKKREPTDQDNINDILDKINDFDQQLKDKKQHLKEIKDIHTTVSRKHKKMQKLEENLVDLKEAEKTVSLKSEALKTAEDNRTQPQKNLDDAQSALNNARDELDLAKNDLDLAKAELKTHQNELKEGEEENATKTEELVNRKSAEAKHAENKQKLEDALKILKEAEENYAKFQKSREKLESKYYLRYREANLDYHLYKKELDLKEAHETLNRAIRQAEANLKHRVEMVAAAKQEKEEFLVEKAANPDKIARKMRNLIQDLPESEDSDEEI
ncbi:MAG: hypothetical protein ACTSRK_16875 [Promethearchaeota archaeon]